MIIISNFKLKKDENGRWHVRCYELNYCPICGNAFIVIGTRSRGYIKDDGIKEILVIRRLRCKGCRVIHHELPDILIPYKRYCSKTVEDVISGNIGNVCCDDLMIRRIRAWWESYRLYFNGAIASLREIYGNVFSAESAPREIVKSVVNANLWLHTRSAVLSS